MIEILKIKSPDQKKKIIDDVDFTQSTWVTYDLYSKNLLQKKLLNRFQVIQDEQVLRAQDFWKTLLLKTRPETRWISKECAEAIIIESIQSPELQKQGVVDLILNYIETLLPVLTHKDGLEAMKDFFEKQPHSLKRWGPWFALSYESWSHFLKNKFALKSWSAGLLINEQNFEQLWKRKIYFDLGAKMKPIEADLIQLLSRHNDVTVIVPDPDWKFDFSKSLKPYESLDGNYLKDEVINSNGQISGHLLLEYKNESRLLYHKCTTSLGEVKTAVSQVRNWLDQGVPLEQISIAAPDISNYWVSLSEHLKVEGVPCKRSVGAPLLTFSDVHRWISRLKVQSAMQLGLSAGAIETSLIDNNEFKLIKYDQFSALFSKVYDATDLNRHAEVNRYFGQQSTSGFYSKEEFIKWASDFWSGEDPTRFEFVVHQFYQDAPAGVRFKIPQWLRLIEALTGKKEFETEKSCKEGIECVDLSSSLDLCVSHQILIGLDESSMQESSKVLIDEFEVQKLRDNYGFLISFPETRQSEFEARWLLENLNQKFCLTFAQSNFNGEALGASLLWLSGHMNEQAKINDNVTLAKNKSPRTRFDEIQYATIQNKYKLKEWSEIQKEGVEHQIRRDLGKLAPTAFQFEVERLSPTALEDLDKCPFIFVAKKMFHLSDLPEVDLDVDYMTRGRLLHSIFDKIIDQINSKFEDKQILQIIEAAKTEIKFTLADEKLWDSLKLKYLQFTRRFIEFEQAWRVKFAKTKTVFKEKDVRGFINKKTAELVTQPSKDTISFYGKIDRVDSDSQNNVVIIDYKFSDLSLKNHSSWLKNHELQLGLYSMAIESGLIDNIKFNVLGAVYYSIKDLRREKGFLLSKGMEEFYELRSRNESQLDSNAKSKLFTDIQSHIKEILLKMDRGEYFAQPSDLDICEKCNWRKICRAPHLN